MVHELWLTAAAARSGVDPVPSGGREHAATSPVRPAAQAWGEALLSEAVAARSPEHPLAGGVRHHAVTGTLSSPSPSPTSIQVRVDAERCWIGREDRLKRMLSSDGWRTMSQVLREEGFSEEELEESIDPSRPADQCADADADAVRDHIKLFVSAPLRTAMLRYFAADIEDYLASWTRPDTVTIQTLDSGWAVVAPPEAISEITYPV